MQKFTKFSLGVGKSWMKRKMKKTRIVNYTLILDTWFCKIEPLLTM